MKWFRGELVVKALRLLYHLTLGSMVLRKKKKYRDATLLFEVREARQKLVQRLHLHYISGFGFQIYLAYIDIYRYMYIYIGLRV